MTETPHGDFLSFMEDAVLPFLLKHPDFVRLDGEISGGNWDVFGRFKYAGREWSVHADTHVEPLFLAYEASKRGEDPFVEKLVQTGSRLDLITELQRRKKNPRYRHLYAYSPGK